MSQRVAPYGTGNAAALIREDLVRRLVDQSASAIDAAEDVMEIEGPSILSQVTARSAAAPAS